MNKIVLFSNDCPRCKILKNKLIEKNIEFETTDDFDEIIEQGFQTTPILKYNEKYYQFGEANSLIQSGELG